MEGSSMGRPEGKGGRTLGQPDMMLTKRSWMKHSQ